MLEAMVPAALAVGLAPAAASIQAQAETVLLALATAQALSQRLEREPPVKAAVQTSREKQKAEPARQATLPT